MGTRCVGELKPETMWVTRCNKIGQWPRISPIFTHQDWKIDPTHLVVSIWKAMVTQERGRLLAGGIDVLSEPSSTTSRVWYLTKHLHIFHHGSPLCLVSELGYPAAAADSDKTALGSVLDRCLSSKKSGSFVEIWTGNVTSGCQSKDKHGEAARWKWGFKPHMGYRGVFPIFGDQYRSSSRQAS